MHARTNARSFGPGSMGRVSSNRAVVPAACSPSGTEVEIDPAKIAYARHARAGLCLAVPGQVGIPGDLSRRASASLAAVPRTPGVLAPVPAPQKEH